MSDLDRGRFGERVAGMTDDELIALLSINASSFGPDAIEIARAESDRRGLSSDIQSVLFDRTINSGGFAGRLILLEEQLMFLSTGMRAAATGGGSIIGAIAADTQAAARNVAATSMDFSALDNEGSWIYYLDQIEECRPNSTLLGGNELQFRIREEDGTVLDGLVKTGELSKSETADLARLILEARDSLNKKSPADKNGA